MREARRVAFWKAIFAKALDLVEATLSKVAIITARDHSSDHLLFKRFDLSSRSEGRHRLAELVRLFGTEFRRVERDLHGLLLEDRHAQGPPENFLKLVRIAMCGVRTREGNRLLA